MSCLAEEAKVLVAEVEENNLSGKVGNERWARWYACSLCEQRYHGVVYCALGWACWKTYVGRPEADQVRGMAMDVLGGGLFDANYHEDAFTVRETTLATMRRTDAPEEQVLAVQANLATTYAKLGRKDEAMRIEKDVYSGRLRQHGEEHEMTLIVANNYASSLRNLQRFEEAKLLLRKTVPVARRVLGENHELTLRMRWNYAKALYGNPVATLDDLLEAVTTLEDTERIARRVLGGAHPIVVGIEKSLREARAGSAPAKPQRKTL